LTNSSWVSLFFIRASFVLSSMNKTTGDGGLSHRPARFCARP
jgi:hypothetical protein